MDLITLGLGIGGIMVTPLGVWVGKVSKRSIDVEKRLTVLETNYLNTQVTLTDLRDEQKNQTQKLDRLVERFL